MASSHTGVSGTIVYGTGEFKLNFTFSLAGDVIVSYSYNYIKP